MANSGDGERSIARSMEAKKASTASVSPSSSKKGEESIFVNSRQKGNRILQRVSRYKLKFVDLSEGPDFIFGSKICALFLSMRYHLLHRDYIIGRMAECPRKDFSIRVLICYSDLDKSHDADALVELTSIASVNNFTVLLCWSEEECARYIEIFKQNESTSTASIQARLEAEYLPRLQEVLAHVPSINRSDAKRLSKAFGSLKSIMSQSEEDFAICNGIGPTKAKQLFKCFNSPFIE